MALLAQSVRHLAHPAAARQEAMTEFAPRYEVLPEAQKDILPLLAEVPGRFVLYGGTAIALQLGHRTSADFDFFSSDAFSFEELQKELPWIASATIVQRAENTLSVIAGKHNPVKLSFFGGLRIGRVSEPRFTKDRRLVVASLLDLAEDGDLKSLPIEVKEALGRAASSVGEIPEIRRVSDSIR